MLLDWRMPDLTGIDVLRRMRGAGRDRAIVWLETLPEPAASARPVHCHKFSD